MKTIRTDRLEIAYLEGDREQGNRCCFCAVGPNPGLGLIRYRGNK
jgi:hypothetical protein